MATLTFSLSSQCPGTNHYDVTLNLGAQSLTLRLQHTDFEELLTKDEKHDFALLLLRFLVGELTNRGVTNVRQKLANASISLSI